MKQAESFAKGRNTLKRCNVPLGRHGCNHCFPYIVSSVSTVSSFYKRGISYKYIEVWKAPLHVTGRNTDFARAAP